MASTYTPLLGLVVPTTGELSGTWGDVLSAGMTQLVDSAIAGTTTLSADADVTLSVTDGAANQARSAVILWTASNGATPRNITVPSHTKAYIVINAGTGSIVVKGAATTGVTIATGVKALIAWNGSDFVRISSSAVALADITGLGTGVATALAINVGSAGAPVVNGGAGGTPSSINLTNATAYPGTSALVTTGALNSGSITSGFGSIDVGADAISGGAITGTTGSFTGVVSTASATITSRFDAANAGTGGYLFRGAVNTAGTGSLAASDFHVYSDASYTQIGTERAKDFKVVVNSAVVSAFTSTGLNSTAIGQGIGGAAAGSFTTLSTSGACTFNSGYGATATKIYCANDTAVGAIAWFRKYADISGISVDGVGIDALNGASSGTVPIAIRGSVVKLLGDTAVTGALSATGLLDLSAATAGQIKFPATPNASADPNTLDDYDEYTAASAACTGAITTAAVWKLTKAGNKVTLTLPTVTGTASATTNFDFGTALPAKYRPADQLIFACPVQDNAARQSVAGMVLISTAGVIKVFKDMTAGANYTAAAAAGLPNSTSVSWTI